MVKMMNNQNNILDIYKKGKNGINTKEEKKIIFINFYPPDTIARYLISSYVLKAYLKKHYEGKYNLNIEIINLSLEIDRSKIIEIISQHNPYIIGYSCYIWNIEKIYSIIKEVKEKIKSIIVLGGPELSIKRIHSLKHSRFIDYFVLGEGERKLLKLLYYLESTEEKDENQGNTSSNFPKGIAHWNKNQLIYQKETKNITDLDEIPSIYLNEIIEERLYAKQQAFIETQRGCRYRCKYCVYPKFLPKIYYYSKERIFNELYHLIVKKEVAAIRVFDAIFPSDLERAKEIIRYILKLKNENNIQLPWIYWEFNYNCIDEEFIQLVALLKNKKRILNSNSINPLDRTQQYSCMVKDYNVINCIGVQSFCKKALETIGRPINNKEIIQKFMDTVNKNNIVLKIDLILGLPFESFESYFNGLEFFLPFFKNTDHILNIHCLQLLPGSELEKKSIELGIKYSKKSNHAVLSTPHFSEDELIYALKLNSILLRVINSPIRQHFFKVKKQQDICFYDIIKEVFDKLKANEKYKNTKVVQNDHIDESYWNNEIYKEIPSKWLIETLNNIKQGSIKK